MKYFYSLYALVLSFPLALLAGVDHKSPHVSSYLEKISAHLDEKTQIKQYVSENNCYLDIGTGGDAIFSIAESLDDNCQCKLIAGDIDPSVLESIKLRKPAIHKYLQNSNGVNVEFQILDATNMRVLQENSLAGIGASALAHEIYSYARPKEPLQLFIEECSRTLKKDGVFIYRDPKWTDQPNKLCHLVLDSKLSRYFAILFLSKFLDTKYTTIQLNGLSYKPRPYDISSIKIHLLEPKNHQEKILDSSELLTYSSSEIDFASKISISAPLGLISELQRHYLVFLKSVFDAQDEKSVREIQNTPLFYLFSNFVEKGLLISYDQVKELLPTLSKKVKERELLLFQSNLDLLLDPKLIVLLYSQSEKDFFNLFDFYKNSLPKEALEFFLLEGDEHYFYKTTDDFIQYVAEQSDFYLSQTEKKGLMLAPISSEKIIFAKRPEYESILEQEMKIIDCFGEVIKPETRKCIIHFRLMEKPDALASLQTIINQSNSEYPSLALWLNKVQSI